MRVVVVDWSGSAGAAAQRRHIWTATAESGVLTDLCGGRTRREVVSGLIAMAACSSDLVVGFDFAFSFPAWFVSSLGLHSAYELWRLVGREGESWLRACLPPFWGRPGAPRPALEAHLRRTEQDHAPAKSVFQVGGAGAVGTGSLRGMPHLAELHDAGFAIWPFDPPGLPTVVEIYPRALTGAVRKRDLAHRRRYLAELELSPAFRAMAEAGEDAFDAAVSALVMSGAEAELGALGPASDPVARLEGEIWAPRGRGLSRSGTQRLASAADMTGGVPIGGDGGVGTPFQQGLGIRWTVVDRDTGTLTVEMDVRDDLRGPAGSLEGGVVSTLVDVAGASAVAVQAKSMVATQHMTVNFLAPGRTGPVRATAVPLRLGTHDGVAEVRVVDAGKDGRLMAVGTVTVRILR